jgi:septal ring factor EnvC (AmiA/AmiB activator)
MVDVDSALLSVQERDNWRRRMEVLERSLSDVREQRRKLELRLRRVRKDLARLRMAADAVLDLSKPTRRPEMVRVPSPAALHNR